MVLTGPTSKHLVELVNSYELVPLAPPHRSAPERSLGPARQFRLSDAQRVAIMRAYQAGQSMASMATEYGVKRDTISKLLREAGIPIRQARQMALAEIDEAARLYESGHSLAKIGEGLGWDHQTIYRHLKKRGIKMRGPNDWQYPT